jgi:hypothetical protein
LRKTLPIFLFLSYPVLLALFSDGDLPKGMNEGISFPYLSEKPFTEDGFYMMTTAWNIAEGKGIKYNFNRPTTGVQPLFTFIQAAVAKAVILSGGDKMDFLRVLIIFSSSLIILFGIVLSKITRLLVPTIISGTVPLFLVLFNFDFIAWFNSGLETGFYLLMISTCIYYSFYFVKNPSYKSAAVFGIISGLTALTRIDFLLPLLIFLILLLITKKIDLVKTFLPGFITAIFIVPWLIYVYSVSGSLLPTSFSNQTSLINALNSIERVYNFFLAFFSHLSPFFHTNNFWFCVVVSAAAVILFYFFAKRCNFFDHFLKDKLNIFFLWGWSFLVLSIVYFIYSSAWYFYDRYTLPLYIFILIISVCLIVYLLSGYFSRYKKVFLAAFILLFFFQAFYYHFSPVSNDLIALRVGFIKKNFEANERIGLFQSGVTGFFVDKAVNLDGKMDHVVKKYAMAGNLDGFLDSMNVNVLIEWGDGLNEMFEKKYLNGNWILYKKDIGDGRTSCFIRKSDGWKMENGRWEMEEDRRQKKVGSME